MAEQTGYSQEDCEQMIQDCEKRETRMTDWEQEFCDSLSQQIGCGRSLSVKQMDVLGRIWDKVTAKG